MKKNDWAGSWPVVIVSVILSLATVAMMIVWVFSWEYR